MGPQVKRINPAPAPDQTALSKNPEKQPKKDATMPMSWHRAKSADALAATISEITKEDK